jgi:hypothetical protein
VGQTSKINLLPWLRNVPGALNVTDAWRDLQDQDQIAGSLLYTAVRGSWGARGAGRALLVRRVRAGLVISLV